MQHGYAARLAATHCNDLQHTAIRCNTLQHAAAQVCSEFSQEYRDPQIPATHCNTLQHTATHCNTLQHAATQVCSEFSQEYRDPQTPATHCNTLQHTATHCNTLQHRYAASLVKSIVTLRPAKGSIRIIPALSRETAGTNLQKSSPQIFCMVNLVAS